MTLRSTIFTIAKHALISATYLAFACRILVPAGYMPAAWGEGGPITLCPTGMPSGLLSQNSDHKHHDSDENLPESQLWENCPLGTLIDTESIISAVQFHTPLFQSSLKIDTATIGVFSTFQLSFRPRAPPFSIT